MDINSVQVFARVVEHQSFTKAAMVLGVEKSTISSKVANLESHLGVRLLNRNTRSVIPTEAGEIYYNHCRKILENAIEAEEFIKTFHNEPEGLLRITAPKGLGRILLKDLFNSFMQQYPGLDLDVFHTRRDSLPPGKRIDLSLVANPNMPDVDGMLSKRIMRFYWGCFATPDYLDKHGNIDSLKQLEAHPTVHYVPPREYMRLLCFQREQQEYRTNFQVRLTVNEITPCVEAIMAGLGVGVLPTSSVRDEVKSGKLIQLLTEFKMAPSSIWVLYPERKWHSPKVEAFLEFITRWGLENTEAPLEECQETRKMQTGKKR